MVVWNLMGLLFTDGEGFIVVGIMIEFVILMVMGVLFGVGMVALGRGRE